MYRQFLLCLRQSWAGGGQRHSISSGGGQRHSLSSGGNNTGGWDRDTARQKYAQLAQLMWAALLKLPPLVGGKIGGGGTSRLLAANRSKGYGSPQRRTVHSEYRSWMRLLRVGLRVVQSTAVAFCVINTVITVVGFPACIYGKSMQPEFNVPAGWRGGGPPAKAASASWRHTYPRLDLDWVWVSCWRARNFSFARGDIVVFVSPKEPYDYVIKRVIALEGDTVSSNSNSRLKVTIPEGHCWVEGDNWGNSVDSNKYGPISKGLIFGVATHVIWPPDKFRTLEPRVPQHLQPERVEQREELQQQIDPAKSRYRNWTRSVKVLFYFFQD